MPYKGNNVAEKQALKAALIELRERKSSFPELSNAITDALRNDAMFKSASDRIRKSGISRELLEKYMRRDVNENWPYEYASVIYNFLETSDAYETKAIPYLQKDISSFSQSKIIDMISSYFQTKDSMSYERLYGLEGRFAMFRRLWSSPSETDFIRSIVTIKREGRWMSYVEEQNYIDPISTSPIKEIDRGYLFVYDRNVFVLTKEDEEQCMKFIVIHDFLPYINTKSIIDIYAGNLIGVSGTGPHPGYPFICRRIKEDDFESRIVTIDQMDAACSKYFAADGKIHI